MNLKNMKWFCPDCNKNQELDTSMLITDNLHKRRNEHSLEEENAINKKLKTEKRVSTRLSSRR